MKRVVLALALTAIILGGNAVAEQSVYDFTMKTIDGKEQPLSAYKGYTLLIVNVASKCGFTPQYKGLEALYEKYKARGFVILGFPANNFMGQEPGTDAQIKEFCSLNYGVTFPMFSKISVKGADIHPLYKYLTESSEPAGPVSWNFNKFLIAPDGRIVGRWGSRTAPEDKEMNGKVEEALSSKTS